MTAARVLQQNVILLHVALLEVCDVKLAGFHHVFFLDFQLCHRPQDEQQTSGKLVFFPLVFGEVSSNNLMVQRVPVSF